MHELGTQPYLENGNQYRHLFGREVIVTTVQGLTKKGILREIALNDPDKAMAKDNAHASNPALQGMRMFIDNLGDDKEEAPQISFLLTNVADVSLSI
ncbi:hypothetical protein KA078_00535 [Candidatus Woesebacteria bacterium]|nr:hypothetical protein [Candidatus Woesebacteria bacterium]